MPDKQGQEEVIIDVKPLHVLLVGSGILGSGLLLTASASYKQAGKQLAAEGIDASIRRKVLPHAVKALTGSLALTGLAAFAGFYALESFGFVNSEAPTSASAFTRAWEMVGRPLPAQQEQQQHELQHQQQQQQQHDIAILAGSSSTRQHRIDCRGCTEEGKKH